MMAEAGIGDLVFQHLLYSVFIPDARHSAGRPGNGVPGWDPLEHRERLCKRGTPCAAARPSATCRGEQDPREGAGGLGKPLQPSRARAPGVVLRLPMLRGSGVGLDRMRPRAPAARTNVY